MSGRDKAATGHNWLRAMGVLGALQAGVIVANLVRIKLVAVETGPVGVGLMSLIEQIVVLVTMVCTLSIPYAAIKFLSAAHSEEGRGFARSFAAFRRALTALSLLGLVVAGAVVLIAPGALGNDVSDNRGILLIALAAIPFVNLLALVTSAIAASGRATAAGALSFANWVMVAILAGTGLLLDGLRGYFIGAGVATALALLAGGTFLRRQERTQDRGGHVRTLHELRSRPGVIRFALLQVVVTVSTPIAYLVARYAVLGEGGLREAGLLATGLAIGGALRSLLAPANALMLTPALNRADPPAVKLGHMLGFRRALIPVLAVAMLPILLFPEVFVVVLFDSEFVSASSFVYLFVLSEAIVIACSMQQGLLIGLDDFGVNIAYLLAGQVVMCVLIITLVPVIGTAAVGLAMIAAYALVFALVTRRLWRRHGMATLQGLGIAVPVGATVLAALGAVVSVLPSDEPVLIAARGALLAVGLAVGSLVAYRAAAPMARGDR